MKASKEQTEQQPKTSKGGMRYASTKRDKKAEASRLIDQMGSLEILSSLYERHAVGFWQTMTLAWAVAAIYTKFTK